MVESCAYRGIFLRVRRRAYPGAETRNPEFCLIVNVVLRTDRSHKASRTAGKSKVHCVSLHKGSEGELYSFFDLGTTWGWMVNAMPQQFYPRGKNPSKLPHCTGGWVGLRTDLDKCGISRLHRGSIPGASSP